MGAIILLCVVWSGPVGSAQLLLTPLSVFLSVPLSVTSVCESVLSVSQSVCLVCRFAPHLGRTGVDQAANIFCCEFPMTKTWFSSNMIVSSAYTR